VLLSALDLHGKLARQPSSLGSLLGNEAGRRTVPGVASRGIRRFPGRSRISVAMTARLAQSSLGLGLVRRSTATSCRRTSSSAFLDADERPSKTSQPQTRAKVRRSGRRDPADDHAARRCLAYRPSSQGQAEYWHPAGGGRGGGCRRGGVAGVDAGVESDGAVGGCPVGVAGKSSSARSGPCPARARRRGGRGARWPRSSRP
jgi:hypothetical protein